MLPTPAPSPTIDPCNHPPAIVSKAPIRDYAPSPLVRGAILHGTSDPFGPVSIIGIPPANLGVSIDVTISANGSPAAARVTSPSGDMNFDRASMQAALQSTYGAAALKCTAVLGHYTFIETLGSIP